MKTFITNMANIKTRRLVEVVCDFCKQEIKPERFSADKVTIEMDKGERYPEGNFYTNKEVDMCVNCFETKLIPWVESQGVQFREHEVD